MPGVDTSLLQEVSRSFSISLRLLPGPMRHPVSLAYLLARASDTIADTTEAAPGEKLAWLDGFIGEMEGTGSAWRGDGLSFVARHPHAGEQRLMERLGECFEALAGLPAPQRRIVQEVAAVITSGQRLDVERFASGPAALPDTDSLEDYCWRVAGCVGAFWTRIGFETLGERFSTADPAELESSGIAYGKGLQLVNILRDLPRDLAAGRCYLPGVDATDRGALMNEAVTWRQQSREWLEQGVAYADHLRSRRLRAASVLPALLGVKTLDLLDAADWQTLTSGVKVGRGVVRRCLVRAIIR